MPWCECNRRRIITLTIYYECVLLPYVRERERESCKERKKDITYIHYVNSPPKMGHLDQDEFHSETTIYLSYLINPHKNGWFLRHFSAPRTCRRYCLAMPPMPLPNACIFPPRGWWCRHNNWWWVSRTFVGGRLLAGEARSSSSGGAYP